MVNVIALYLTTEINENNISWRELKEKLTKVKFVSRIILSFILIATKLNKYYFNIINLEIPLLDLAKERKSFVEEKKKRGWKGKRFNLRCN